jgi:hypothetical protein
MRFGIVSIPTIMIFKDGEPGRNRGRSAAQGRARDQARPRRSRGLERNEAGGARRPRPLAFPGSRRSRPP